MPTAPAVVMLFYLIFPGQPPQLVAHDGFATMAACQEAVEEKIGELPPEMLDVAGIKASCTLTGTPA